MKMIAVLLGILCTQLAWSQTRPEATFEQKGKQLGEVYEGTLVRTVYYFQNTGGSDLILTEVAPSCGCTVAEYPKYPIKPGARDSIVATFDTHERTGYQAKGINIQSNIGEINLVFEVEVKPSKGLEKQLGRPYK